METVNFETLLSAKYRPFGRGPEYYDCYGYVIECCRLKGIVLKDITIDWRNKSVTNVSNYLLQLNVVEIASPEPNCILQTDYKQELHIGFCTDAQTVTHMTYEGARVQPLMFFKNKKFYRVIKE